MTTSLSTAAWRGSWNAAVQRLNFLIEEVADFLQYGDGVDLLGDLPENISGLRNGQKLAAEMAEALTAAMINDPLFGGVDVS